MKILTKYVLGQFIVNILLSLLLFIFILLMDRVFQLINLIVAKGLNPLSVISLILYSIPTILGLSMPMSVLAGAILTYGKMAGDGEVTVIRTSGNTLKPIVMPVLFFSFAISALMIPFNNYIAPNSQYKFRKKFLTIALKDPALRLEESTLININPYTLLCLSVNHKKHQLKDILITKNADIDEPAVSITAESGKWYTSDDDELILDLFNGNISYQPLDDPDKFSSINFKDYRLTLTSPKDASRDAKNIESMTSTEIKEEIAELKKRDLPTHKIETRYHLRTSLAAAVFLLMLPGVPLGIRAEKKGKTIGIGLSIGIIAVYYFLMVAGIKLAFGEVLPPALGVWLPNIIIAVPGIVLMKKSYFR